MQAIQVTALVWDRAGAVQCTCVPLWYAVSGSGLVLFTYVVTYLANYTLGLIALICPWWRRRKSPLRVGLGIHTGPAVVGRMGRDLALYLAAVGDTVHVASRRQELTQDH